MRAKQRDLCFVCESDADDYEFAEGSFWIGNLRSGQREQFI